MALLMAGIILALMGAVGLAVDMTRIWMVQSRLNQAIDAAALTGARGQNSASRDSEIGNLFWANFVHADGRPTGTLGYLNAVVTNLTIASPDANTLSVSATALVPTSFMRLFGITGMPVQASNSTARATYGMELALVLDNTGSMAGWPMDSVIASATSLVNILYGGGGDTLPNLFVSVVPFAAVVNVGAARAGWLSSPPVASDYGGDGWMGCVMARVAGGQDFTDTPPAAAPFTAYLYASTLGKYAGGGKPVVGDNDWKTGNITDQKQASTQNYTVGPNLGCPHAAVLPLTASRATVQASVAKMEATFRGGTFINLGLQAGWWTLSPRWRGLWGSPALPLDYNTAFMRKVVVLMTDGNNEWYDWDQGAPGAGLSPWVNDGDADFTAYGRLKQNLMGIAGGITAGNATTTLNASMSTMCTLIKAKGITVYTIIFNHSAVAAATISLFQACATTPGNFFLAPTDADLKSAFSEIGSQLASLRLTR